MVKRAGVFVIDWTIITMTASLFVTVVAWRAATDTLDGWRKKIEHG